jgi:hypothetical protein
MRIISDSDDQSDVDELSYESDSVSAPKSQRRRSGAVQNQSSDEVSEVDQVDELESEEDIEVSTTRQSSHSRGQSRTKQKKSTQPKAKLIYFDAVNIPKGDKSTIEKFVSTRTDKDGTELILVKYKNLSYIHAEWLPIKDMEEDKNLRLRVRRFLEKPAWENQWSEDEPFNPAYCKVCFF